MIVTCNYLWHFSTLSVSTQNRRCKSHREKQNAFTLALAVRLSFFSLCVAGDARVAWEAVWGRGPERRPGAANDHSGNATLAVCVRHMGPPSRGHRDANAHHGQLHWPKEQTEDRHLQEIEHHKNTVEVYGDDLQCGWDELEKCDEGEGHATRMLKDVAKRSHTINPTRNNLKVEEDDTSNVGLDL